MPKSDEKRFYRKEDLSTVIALTAIILICAGFSIYWFSYLSDGPLGFRPSRYAPANKIHTEGDRQYLWAAGPIDPAERGSEWFDLTGSPLPLAEFQFGIGRDSIPAIDHPVFVKPDDATLKGRWAQRGQENIDELSVIGYEHNGDARAYPIQLLNRHELVNDTVGGRPVTVGW